MLLGEIYTQKKVFIEHCIKVRFVANAMGSHFDISNLSLNIVLRRIWKRRRINLSDNYVINPFLEVFGDLTVKTVVWWWQQVIPECAFLARTLHQNKNNIEALPHIVATERARIIFKVNDIFPFLVLIRMFQWYETYHQRVDCGKHNPPISCLESTPFFLSGNLFFILTTTK